MVTAKELIQQCEMTFTLPQQTDKAIRLKKDIEGKFGTMHSGTLVKPIKVSQQMSTVNITVQDAKGNIALIQWTKPAPFPHEFVRN